MKRLLSVAWVYDVVQSVLGSRRGREHLSREFIRPFPGAQLLDIGCGTGRLLDLLPLSVDYVGLDISADYIRSAARRYGGRGRFAVASVDASSLEVGHNYDIAVALGVLHHLCDADAAKLLDLADRALKADGRLVTIDGALVPGQNRLARWLILHDRGKYVRSPEQYFDLAARAFPRVETTVLNGLNRVPYTHCVLSCRRR